MLAIKDMELGDLHVNHIELCLVHNKNNSCNINDNINNITMMTLATSSCVLHDHYICIGEYTTLHLQDVMYAEFMSPQLKNNSKGQWRKGLLGNRNSS